MSAQAFDDIYPSTPNTKMNTVKPILAGHACDRSARYGKATQTCSAFNILVVCCMSGVQARVCRLYRYAQEAYNSMH